MTCFFLSSGDDVVRRAAAVGAADAAVVVAVAEAAVVDDGGVCVLSAGDASGTAADGEKAGLLCSSPQRPSAQGDGSWTMTSQLCWR